jgi:hypothetical protein
MIGFFSERRPPMREVLFRDDQNFLEVADAGTKFLIHQLSIGNFGESEQKIRLTKKTAKKLAEFILANL